MSISKNVAFLEDALKDFSPVTLDYGKDKVIGFPNENGSSDLVIFIKKDEMVMTFGFQNAHFAGDDALSCAEHTKKYLNSEYSSVEFFVGDKDVFGGSRLSSTVKFDTLDGIIDCYSCGVEQAKEGLIKFFKENKDITVRAISYDNKVNFVSKIDYDGKEIIVTVVR